MKIATFNVNSIRKRLPLVLDWLERHKPDVLCLQETKVQDSDFPSLALASTGYHVTFRGGKSYNGVAVLSRTEPEAVSYGLDDGGSPDEERLIRVVVRGIPIINTYVPQGFELDSPKYAYKLNWFKRLRTYFQKHLSPTKPAIWCGDMNVAPTPIDVHSPEKHLKHVCYHEDAR
ncbi:MAG TPA: exodeoxyribonuclease III, partial [Candidatus Binatia bacterium]|nr:exodeoxyribonuclease III [Candidatus Binatia bacterium]